MGVYQWQEQSSQITEQGEWTIDSTFSSAVLHICLVPLHQNACAHCRFPSPLLLTQNFV